jgi:O-antigen/teichoic acid export membrane protein
MVQKVNESAGGRLLAKNSLINLIGLGAPMVVALFTIPLLIKGLGTERFGVLTLVWMVIGYFSLFDMGLSRALTKLVAEKIGAKAHSEIPAIFSTGMLIMLSMGVVGGGISLLITPWLVTSVLKIPIALQGEMLKTFWLLAFSIPIVVTTAGLRGILEAYQRFDIVNMLRVPMGLFSYVGPLFVLPFTNNLAAIVTVLLIGRVFFWGIHLWYGVRLILQSGAFCAPNRHVVRSLVTFGGWITVANIVGPIIDSFDRFLLGTMVSVSAVAYYSTPYEVVARLRLIPTALTGVLFPAFSSSYVSDRNHCLKIYMRGIKYTFMSLFPVVLLIITFGKEGLTIWLGEEFAGNSFHVLQWLAAGVFINCLGYMPVTLVTGTGRPDLATKLLLIELPIYLTSAWFLIGRFGITGMAIAWAMRATMDSILLMCIAKRVLTEIDSLSRTILVTIVIPLAIFYLATLLSGLIIKISFVVMILTFFTLVAWQIILGNDEKLFIRGCLRLA